VLTHAPPPLTGEDGRFCTRERPAALFMERLGAARIDALAQKASKVDRIA
jgi:hypothetical protein